MRGLLVKIRGSRRHWLVVGDDGRTLTLAHGGIVRNAERGEVTARKERGIGWVDTAVEAVA